MADARPAAGSLGPRLAGRLTAELMLRSPQYMSAIKLYEIDLRGAGALDRVAAAAGGPLACACARPLTRAGTHVTVLCRQQDSGHREPGHHPGACAAWACGRERACTQASSIRTTPQPSPLCACVLPRRTSLTASTSRTMP